MNEIIVESEVACSRGAAEVEELKWEPTLLLSTTQMGGVIAWPTSSTPRTSHVAWYIVVVWANAELDTLPSIVVSQDLAFQGWI